MKKSIFIEISLSTKPSTKIDRHGKKANSFGSKNSHPVILSQINFQTIHVQKYRFTNKIHSPLNNSNLTKTHRTHLKPHRHTYTHTTHPSNTHNSFISREAQALVGSLIPTVDALPTPRVSPLTPQDP